MKRFSGFSFLRMAGLGLLIAAAVATGGCIRSRLHIESNPSDAVVTINDQPYGKTPIETPFIWYWYYDVKVEKPGYQTVEDEQYLGSPAWAIFPLDFFAEALPFPISDNRHLQYDLKPATVE